MEGVREWRNAKNKFYVFRLHYSADPEKRSSAWREEARAGMPERGWRQEYEIDFTAPAGEPVTPEFEHGLHVRDIPVREGLLLRGWDFGNVTPAVVFAQMDVWDRLTVVSELVPFNVPLDSLIAMVKSRSLDLMGRPDAKVFDAGDPAGDSTTDLGQVRAVLMSAGISLHTRRMGKTEVRGQDQTYELLRERLRKMVRIPGEGLVPGFAVKPSCPLLIEALGGAFHLRDTPPYTPVPEHPFKDVVDALRYLNANMTVMNVDWQRAAKEMATRDII